MKRPKRAVKRMMVGEVLASEKLCLEDVMMTAGNGLRRPDKGWDAGLELVMQDSRLIARCETLFYRISELFRQILALSISLTSVEIPAGALWRPSSEVVAALQSFKDPGFEKNPSRLKHTASH